MRVPVVELSECILCGICPEVAPTVFKLNLAGYIEVIELDEYPVRQVDEAIAACPVSCIYWETQ